MTEAYFDDGSQYDEAPVADDVVTEDQSVEQEKPRRGRPRSQETLARDEQVLKLLSDGQPRSRRQIADEIGVEEQSIVYLSLYRLRRDGRIQRVSDSNGARFAWTTV